MNLSRAQYILTILEEGSISAAAHKLFLSQAALSQAVRYVEEEVGLPVLQRGRGVVRLTYAGERYVETVRQMLLLERSFRNEIDEIKREESGQFRFGIPLHSGQVTLPGVLAEFLKDYPSVRLQVVEKGSPELVRMILQGELDLAVVRSIVIPEQEQDQPKLEKGIVYELLQEEQMGILAGKGSGLYEKHPDGTPVDIEEAVDERFVFMKKGHSSRHTQDMLLEQRNLELQAVVELDNFETAKQVAINCGGVIISPYSNVYSDLHFNTKENAGIKNDVHFYPLKGAEAEENTYLIYHEATYLTPYMKRWIELVKEIYKNR